MRKERAGVVSVDSGLIWLGDPSYIMFQTPEEVGLCWDQFWRIAAKKSDRNVAAFTHEGGTSGLGVAVSTGTDGRYPVFVERDEDGLVSRVIIDLTKYAD